MDLLSILPKLAPAVGDREAIADAMYRCLWGFNTADAALFESSFQRHDSLEEVKAQCFDPISKMDTTQFLTNVHVNYVERKPKAVRTRWGLTQHYAPGQGFRMVPSRSLWEACLA
uniref:Uncharacterized protein n=1 Tax=Talaromyces marneffei PM1 TaxID=1077442 RepID=A0A093XA38_TALMA